MKQYSFNLFLVAFILILPTQIFAWNYDYNCNCNCNYSCDWNYDWNFSDVSINVRSAYFYPFSKKVRKIYSEGWADYQLEFASKWNENWQLWTGVSGFSKKGHSLGLHHHTRLTLIPLSLGLKYLFCFIPNTQFYVGAGLCYSWLRIKDDSEYVHEHIRKRAFGGVAQLGAYYYFMECFFANVFVDYFYQEFNFRHNHYSPYVERHDLNISGVKIGAGVGMNF